LACGHPLIGLRDEPIEFDRSRSRSAYQTQSSRPPSGFAALGWLARKIALKYKCNFRPQPTAALLADVAAIFQLTHKGNPSINLCIKTISLSTQQQLNQPPKRATVEVGSLSGSEPGQPVLVGISMIAGK